LIQLSHGANTLVGDQGVMLSGVRWAVLFRKKTI
jgi:hypothetical protein